MKNTARDFFLYLFATCAVYFLSVNLIILLWEYVNYFFPDPYGGYWNGASPQMRFAISSIIIVFPIYAVVVKFLSKNIDRNPQVRDFWVRKWAIYVTLFISAITIVIDLVVVLNTFLGGDFAVRFILEAASVLLVAGAVFYYYLYSLRRKPGENHGKAITGVIWVVILALVIGAFFIVGSPAANRERNLDNQRITDLSNIQWQIVNYWREEDELPESLEIFNDPVLQSELPLDPESEESYVYKRTGSLSFELCASFLTESRDFEGGDAISPEAVGDEFYNSRVSVLENSIHWRHAKGEWCFVRELDPERHDLDFPKELLR